MGGGNSRLYEVQELTRKNDQVEACKLIAKKHPDPNEWPKGGKPLLETAARYNRTDVVQALINGKKGCDTLTLNYGTNTR
jgi:hypothetical protein